MRASVFGCLLLVLRFLGVGVGFGQRALRGSNFVTRGGLVAFDSLEQALRRRRRGIRGVFGSVRGPGRFGGGFAGVGGCRRRIVLEGCGVDRGVAESGRGASGGFALVPCVSCSPTSSRDVAGGVRALRGSLLSR